MGLKFLDANDKMERWVFGNLTVFVYEYEYKSQWYIGDDLHKREEIQTSFTFSDKHSSSRRYSFDEVEVLENEIKKEKQKS